MYARDAFAPTTYKSHWILKGFSVKMRNYIKTWFFLWTNVVLSGLVVCANDTEALALISWPHRSMVFCSYIFADRFTI